MALEGRLEGREQTRTLLCAGREACLREGAVLHQELVEMMDHHQQSREGLGVPGGDPCAHAHAPGTACPP